MEMTKYAPFMYTTEIENLSQLCYRAFDNSNYDVRCTVAKLLGFVLATTQNPPKEFVKGKNVCSSQCFEAEVEHPQVQQGLILKSVRFLV